MHTERSRAFKDISKLRKILREFVKAGLSSKYPTIYQWAENYARDGLYFYKKKDYFTAFGCANYAYGIIDAILILEGKK